MSNSMGFRSLHRLTRIIAGFIFLLFSLQTSYAANGDLVHTTNFTTACPSGTGVGVAFDGEFLWYSCAVSNPDLYKARALDGVVVATYNIAGGLGALAWDGSRKKIWAGAGCASGQTGAEVYLIDPVTGSSSIQFSISGFLGNCLDDGLAYDGVTDTLYHSWDGATTISHLSTSGVPQADNGFAWGGSGCYNSGLAIGGQLLYQGSNGCNHVWVVNKVTKAAAFNFATGAGGVRDEDLECDNVTFRPRAVMWSVEAYEPRRAIAFEIPPGTCATGGGVDSDGDGLLDEWETDGITIDPDGDGPVAPQFINLSAMGADVNKPDIYLQIDWMQDLAHSHVLLSAAVKKVVDAFAASPYTSPTGSVGVNLHVDQGPTSILNFTTSTTWGALSRAQALTHVSNLGTSDAFGNYDWTAFQALKDTNFTPTGRTPIFHYVISAHNYDSTTSSGISRGISASDLIVSLGSFPGGVGTLDQQAGTLMHELGHNLNLRHGGDVNTNYKPNYLSVMSYAFQMGGVILGGAGTFDYSRTALAALNETSLNEPIGLGAAATGFGTRYLCGAVQKIVLDAAGAIDWNCNANSTEVGITADINGDGATTTLSGYNDWTNLKLKGGAIGLAGVSAVLPTITEADLLTVEVANSIPPIAPTPIYSFTGFFQPIDNPDPVNVFNTVKAGSAIPAKFSLGGDQGMDIFVTGYPKAVPTSCPGGGVPTDAIEETVTAGASGLRYDSASQRYIYVWKTQKTWATKCYKFVMRLNDGSEHYANFMFTK